MLFSCNKEYLFPFLCISHGDWSFNTYYMKRYFFLFTVLCFSLVTFAQEFNYGVTAGLNVSHPKDYRNHVGFNVGVKGEYTFSDKQDCLYLESALLLTSKGWKTDVYADESENAGTADWTCDAYYLELPLMVGY